MNTVTSEAARRSRPCLLAAALMLAGCAAPPHAGGPEHELAGTVETAGGFAPSPDGTQLAHYRQDRHLELVSVADGKSLWSLETGLKEKEGSPRLSPAPAFAPDPAGLYALVKWNEMKLLESATGKVVREFPLNDRQGRGAAPLAPVSKHKVEGLGAGGIRCIAATGDGRWLAVGAAGGAIRILKGTNLEEAAVITGETSPDALAFDAEGGSSGSSPAGRSVSTAGAEASFPGLPIGIFRLPRAPPGCIIHVTRMTDTTKLGAGDEAALRLLATRVPAILWSTDYSLNVSSCSGKGLEAFGKRGSGMLGRTIPLCFGVKEADDASLKAHLRALVGEETTYDTQWGNHWFRCHVAPLAGQEGRVVGVVGAALEITESKLLETQLLHSQKIEGIGRLAGGIAHDFNNLLTSILGNAELASLKIGDSDGLRQEIGAIKDAGQRAARLTRQLLAFGRKQVLQPRILDLNAVVRDFEQILRRTIGEHIEFRTVLDPELGRVRADRGQLDQILMNLVVNARDAMPRGGTLTIRTSNTTLDERRAARGLDMPEGDYVSLAVTDTGAGMDEATQSKLFEPFFTTKDVGQGTGLGLSMVYGIVQQSGGSISVRSAPGRGSAFEILLPQAGGDLEPESTTAILAIKDPARGAETVLVAEDDAGVLLLVTAVLKKAGYKILQARDGVEALEVLRDHADPIHLLLTDVAMPRMSGPELARKTRELRPSSRILFMSGYTGDGLAQHGVLERGTHLLEKPFTPETLAAKVRRALDRSK